MTARADVFDTEKRAAVMRAVRSKDTKPERLVRRLLWSQGYRYRLCRRDLPGSPDLVFSTRKAVVFVHGCFWHGHDCRRGARAPKSNAAYWTDKIARNRTRDAAVLCALEQMGWRAATVWECELRSQTALLERLIRFLDEPCA